MNCFSRHRFLNHLEDSASTQSPDPPLGLVLRLNRQHGTAISARTSNWQLRGRGRRQLQATMSTFPKSTNSILQAVDDTICRTFARYQTWSYDAATTSPGPFGT